MSRAETLLNLLRMTLKDATLDQKSSDDLDASTDIPDSEILEMKLFSDFVDH